MPKKNVEQKDTQPVEQRKTKAIKKEKTAVKRMRTGIFGLDEFISGGIPLNSIMLVLGEPGTGKSTFSFNFIHEGLLDDESCIFISTSDTPEFMLDTMEAIGLDHTASRNLSFIDCYSWRLGTPPKAKYSISQPTDLNQLSLAIDRALGDGKPPYRIVFDSLSDIMLHVKPEVAMKFIQVISAKVKGAGGVGIFTLEEGMHEEKHVKTIEYLADGVFNMYVEGENRFIRIKKMAKTLHTLKPILFRIATKKGLGVEISEFFK